MKSLKLFLFAALALSIMGGVSSCYKKKDTIAKIFVKNASNEPLVGAKVELDPDPSTTNSNGVNEAHYPMNGVTNSEGFAEFNFNEVYQAGQAGVAVLKITAEFEGSKSNGIIKVEQEVTTEEVVYI